MSKNRDIYQEVTDTILERMKECQKDGSTPWAKPWDSKGDAMSLPINGGSGRAYNGINVLLLWISAMQQGFNSSHWFTYNQAKKLGAQVRKGEKGTMVTLWKPTHIRLKEDEGQLKKGDKKQILLLRSFTVFNADQIDGLEGYEPPVVGDTDINELAAEVGANVQYGGGTACFIPSADIIKMPSIDDFICKDNHDATLSHELVHWTGHKDRLSRRTLLEGRFGDEAYAMEELVAEMGSAFICAEYGIEMTELQHDKYLAHWIQKLEQDKKAIFTAASQARQAVEFLKEQAAAEDLQEAA